MLDTPECTVLPRSLIDSARVLEASVEADLRRVGTLISGLAAADLTAETLDSTHAIYSNLVAAKASIDGCIRRLQQVAAGRVEILDARRNQATVHKRIADRVNNRGKSTK